MRMRPLSTISSACARMAGNQPQVRAARNPRVWRRRVAPRLRWPPAGVPVSEKVQRKCAAMKTRTKRSTKARRTNEPALASEAQAATVGDASQGENAADAQAATVGDASQGENAADAQADRAIEARVSALLARKPRPQGQVIMIGKGVGDLRYDTPEEKAKIYAYIDAMPEIRERLQAGELLIVDPIEGESPEQERVRKVTAPLFKMRDGLAELGQHLDEKYLLDTARVLEGVLKCLAEPRERDKLSRAATVLIGSASSLPRLPGEIKTAANALVDSVREVLVYFEKQFPGQTPTDELLARQINRSRDLNEYRGAGIVLPHDGSSEERESLFADVIGKMRSNSDGGRLPNPEEIIAACARELGNKREIFGAKRKRERRKDLK